MRHRFDEHEFRGLDKVDYALGDAFVVKRIDHIIGACGSCTVNREFEIDLYALLDAALPIYEADDTLDLKTSQKNFIGSASRHGISHSLKISRRTQTVE